MLKDIPPPPPKTFLRRFTARRLPFAKQICVCFGLCGRGPVLFLAAGWNSSRMQNVGERERERRGGGGLRSQEDGPVSEEAFV